MGGCEDAKHGACLHAPASSLELTVVRAGSFLQILAEGAFTKLEVDEAITPPANAIRDPFVDLDAVMEVASR